LGLTGIIAADYHSQSNTGSTPAKNPADITGSSGNGFTPSDQQQPCPATEGFSATLSTTPCNPGGKVTNATTKPNPNTNLTTGALNPSATKTTSTNNPTFKKLNTTIDKNNAQVMQGNLSPNPTYPPKLPPPSSPAPAYQPQQYPVTIGTPASNNGRISNYSMYMLGNIIGQLLNRLFGYNYQYPTPLTPVTPPIVPPVNPPEPRPATSTPALPPVVSLVANPDTVAPGGISTLSWASIGAMACVIYDTDSYLYASSTGSVDTPALATTTTFIMDCEDAAGSIGESTTTVFVR
jgi:hypothetical protein